MNRIKFYLGLPLFLLMTAPGKAESNLVAESWGEIRGFLITETDSPAPQTLDTPELNNRIAELTADKKILISAAFVAKLESSGLNYDKQKEIMLFLLGHEVAHKYPPKDLNNAEYHADFLSALLIGGMNINYLSAPESFFKFSGTMLKADNTHGSPEARQKKLVENSEQIRSLSKKFSGIMGGLNSGNAGRIRGAIGELDSFSEEILKPGYGEFTGFSLALAVARHKVWLLSAPNKGLGVQISLYVPQHPESRRGAKGATDIPGDKALFHGAKKAYKTYLATSPGDARAQMNYLALIAYEAEPEAIELFAKLRSGKTGDAQYLNNLGAVAYILAGHDLVGKEVPLEILNKAAQAKTDSDAFEHDLAAKILFNLARAYDKAGQATEAETAMQKYRAHAYADKCWMRENFSCPTAAATKSVGERFVQLAGFKLGMNVKEAQAAVKSALSGCTPRKIRDVSEVQAILNVDCPSPASEFSLIFASGKLAFIQLSGEKNPAAALRLGATDKIELGLARTQIDSFLPDADSGNPNQRGYAGLGLYIILDDRQTIYSMAIGDETHMDWLKKRRKK